MTFRADPDWLEELTRLLDPWEQGDVFPCPQAGFLNDPARPLTEESEGIRASETWNGGFTWAAANAPHGVAIVSQTCDIIKSADRLPFVLAAPLRQLDGNQARLAQQGRMPQFAPLPGASPLFVDLGAIFTLEKSILANQSQLSGCRTDAERREFATAIRRFFDRFAFPDDFGPATANLRTRFTRQGGNDAEGRARDLVFEVRARCVEGDWTLPEVTVHFYFLVRSEDELESLAEQDWRVRADEWLGDCTPVGKLKSFYGEVVTLERLPTSDYLASDHVDIGVDS